MSGFRHFIVLLLFLVHSSSARCEEDVFAGCYSLVRDGETWIKIEKPEDSYYLSLKDREGWQEAVSLHSGSQQELSELFGSDGARIKSSLIADKGFFALFHVQAGETYSGYKAKTDYFIYILIGSGPAYKKDCPVN